MDILITKTNLQLETDIYFQPADSRQYLLFISSHPKHTRINHPTQPRQADMYNRLKDKYKRPKTKRDEKILIKITINCISNSTEKSKQINIHPL